MYLAIRREVHCEVQTALHRDIDDYRLRNCCPACTYKLKDEESLVFDLLFTMDGGDSLKRVLGRGPPPPDDANTGDEPRVGLSNEYADMRTTGDDYFLARAKVDEWAHEALEKLAPLQSQVEVSLYSYCFKLILILL